MGNLLQDLRHNSVPLEESKDLQPPLQRIMVQVQTLR